MTKENVQKTSRDSKFELLRIICMVFIVTHHFLLHGGFLAGAIGANYYFAIILQALSRMAVNIFIIISAYFLITQKFRFKKCLKLWLTVVFYTIMIFLIFLCFGLVKFSFGTMFLSFLPVINQAYWFITAYFIMYLFSPYLNILINNLDKNKYVYLLVGISALSFLVTFGLTNSLPIFSGYNALWFLCLYLMTGYLRKFDFKLTKDKNVIAIILFIACLLMSIYKGDYSSPFVFINSFIVFLWFKQSKSFYNKNLNYVSGLMFGVYIIHENFLLSGRMYNNIFCTSLHNSGPFSLLIMLGFVAALFVVCCVIEALRQLLFLWIEKLILKIKSKRTFDAEKG